MIRLLRLTFVVSLLVWPTVAWCQGLDVNKGQRRLMLDTSKVDALAKATGEAGYQTRNQPARDSLWNGVIAGAAVGAIAGAFGGLALSNDCSECAGFNVPLTFGVLGAGIGIGIGAGIDALRSAGAPPPDSGAATVRVSPVVGKGTRGLMASIGFDVSPGPSLWGGVATKNSSRRIASWRSAFGIVAPRGNLSRALTFTFTNGKVTRVEVIGDPARLRELAIAVL